MTDTTTSTAAPVVPPPVPNPYRAALDRALHVVEGEAGTLSQALRAVQSAMDGGAWKSTTADAFAAAAADHRARLVDCGDASVSAVRQARDAQPLQVPADAWQIRWRSVR